MISTTAAVRVGIVRTAASRIVFARRGMQLCCLAAWCAASFAAAPAMAIPLANLEVWLNADNVVGADGSTVNAWNDASGNNHHAVAYSGNAATHPTLQNGIYAGHNALRFTSATALRNNSISSLNDMTVFMVYNWNSLSTQNWMLSFGANDPEYGVGDQSVNATVYDAGYRQYNLLPQTTDVLYRAMYLRSAGNQNTLTLQDGSTQTLNFAYGVTATTYQLASQGFGSITGTANVDIAEILIYDGALSLADQQAVLDYLTNKFDPPPALVPEPTSWLLLGFGCIALVMFARRRAARHAS